MLPFIRVAVIIVSHHSIAIEAQLRHGETKEMSSAQAGAPGTLQSALSGLPLRMSRARVYAESLTPH